MLHGDSIAQASEAKSPNAQSRRQRSLDHLLHRGSSVAVLSVTVEIIAVVVDIIALKSIIINIL